MQNKIERFALRDLVHRNILERILQGKLPPGSRVKDTNLSNELQVSRTPVREALVRLVKEGFMQNNVGKGFVVQPLTVQEVEEVYPIIWTLEVLALRTSKNLSREVWNKFKGISEKMEMQGIDFIDLIELDQQWHQTLLSGCTNRHLMEMIDGLKSIAFRYEYAYMQHQELVKTSIKEHQDIVKALIFEGREVAIPLLKKHWESSMKSLLKKLGDEEYDRNN